MTRRSLLLSILALPMYLLGWKWPSEPVALGSEYAPGWFQIRVSGETLQVPFRRANTNLPPFLFCSVKTSGGDWIDVVWSDGQILQFASNQTMAVEWYRAWASLDDRLIHKWPEKRGTCCNIPSFAKVEWSA